MDIQILLEELKNELKNIYGMELKKIILYGSYARKEATSDSDIDLMIVLQKNHLYPGKEIDKIIHVITDLNLKYNTLISILPVPEKDYESENSPLLMNARKEGIVL